MNASVTLHIEYFSFFITTWYVFHSMYVPKVISFVETDENLDWFKFFTVVRKDVY